MTKRHSATVLSTELERLAKQPLDQADDAVLVRVARAFWYSTANLETALNSFLRKHRSDVEVRRAGYLFERLTQFTCATDSRVSEANRALNLVVFHKQNDVVAKGRVDRLALSWGLEKGLGLKVQALMPYQTRHFEATQRQMHLA
ncbi:hypothetical protein AL066_17010 [Pseudomonas nunensis]|uniref:Uncharacterized protein n=2 Tax=Pseudomonas nunensis TaxID=2961896 RepID=A0ABY5EQ85_9PSED|nr:hypothetical protein [Pseudomonas nunensis]KPN93031.1 hypothetical protein AL066_17010 [Pseudomonas nunensis]MCL5228839.1 hypothetical protein [Pseudomonas nunensis]UTO17883.1 hypothetical protein NK667_18510 [Pseudomonas nunensis]